MKSTIDKNASLKHTQKQIFLKFAANFKSSKLYQNIVNHFLYPLKYPRRQLEPFCGLNCSHVRISNECLWARDLTIAGSAKRKHEGVFDNALVELVDGIMQFSYHSKMNFAVLFFSLFILIPSSISHLVYPCKIKLGR